MKRSKKEIPGNHATVLGHFTNGLSAQLPRIHKELMCAPLLTGFAILPEPDACIAGSLLLAGMVYSIERSSGHCKAIGKRLPKVMSRVSNDARTLYTKVMQADRKLQVEKDERPPVDKARPDGKDASNLTYKKKDWQLNREAFQRLLFCLDSDLECAANKYVAVCRRLEKFFEYRGCHSPLEYADETLNRVCRRLYEGEVIEKADLHAYIYGVARNILREYGNCRERHFIAIDCLQPQESPSIDPAEVEDKQSELLRRERLYEQLERCMQRLSPENRDLLINYYKGEKIERIENRRRLADSLGTTTNALKIRVHRMKKLLEDNIDN